MIKWLYSFAKIETASVMSERKRLTTNCVGKKMNRPSNKDNPDYLSAGWKKKWNITEKKKKVKKEIANNKQQVPWKRISILTGTAFAVQCSIYWAAGNLP